MIHKMHFQTSTRKRLDSGSSPLILVITQRRDSQEERPNWEEEADRSTATVIYEFLHHGITPEARAMLAKLLNQ